MADRKKAINTLKAIDRHTFDGDELLRQEALQEAHFLLERIEKPFDKMSRLIGVGTVVLAALQTAIDMGLLVALGTSVSEENLKGKTLDQLSEATKAERKLIKRILNVLAGEGTVIELADTMPVRYAPTEFSVTLTHPYAASYLTFQYGLLYDMYGSVPKYLRSIGYRNPFSFENAGFQYVKGPGLLWPWIEAEEGRKSHFQNMMSYIGAGDLLAAVNGDTRNEIQKSQADEKSIKAHSHVQAMIDLLTAAGSKRTSTEANAITLVDVGGGQGSDILNFVAYYPGKVPGRVVLLDSPAMVDSALKSFLSDRPVEGAGHDFFNEFPAALCGARLYHLGAVLHDWPDAYAVKILKRISAAMKPGYSQLVLHERIVPETKPSLAVSVMDWWMMAYFSAAERTLAEYTDLMSQAGLRFVRMFDTPDDPMDVVVFERV